MRKLLILIVVLGMASMANATLQISVDGDSAPVDSEIYITEASQTLVLDVHTDVTMDYTGTYLLMTVDAAEGTLSGGVPTQGGTSSNLDAYANYFMYYAGVTSTMYGYYPFTSGVAGNVSDTGETTTFDGLIYDEILFHCEALTGDTVISLYSSSNSGPGTWSLDDQVIIHQIPEPMTMVLLGLGGLLLRRRK